MKFDEAYSGNVFIKSHPVFEESEAVLYGMPMDWTVYCTPLGLLRNRRWAATFSTRRGKTLPRLCTFRRTPLNHSRWLAVHFSVTLHRLLV